MDIAIGNSGYDHKGIDMWMVDLPNVNLGENYVLQFSSCLFSKSHFCLLYHHQWKGLSVFRILVSRVVAFPNQVGPTYDG